MAQVEKWVRELRLPIFTRDNTRVLYIHVPKAAGTSIEEAFLASGYEMTYRRGGVYGPMNEFDRSNGCSPQHMHAELLERHFGEMEFDLIFTVVRDPVKRFISEYRFRVQSGHSYVEDLTVDSFAKKALSDCESCPMLLDNHIRPQVDFIWRDCEIFTLEDGLDRVFESVSKTLSGPVSAPKGVKMKSNKSIDAHLSPENIQSLRSFYAKDLEAFGYV